ncbi:type VII secretion protein EccB [Corynebacterium heidelbergense]|uniref:Type VII secretion protein EccB n=1 Tax=Corynebacterium heidelbergense TaxID=2055947 RepID=A0A364VCN4_9CORY|nr:type VII secretion protein EccB [Corynebacterium heidelbergense]RAV34415.1 type VII secretion protein EccB [Corynebacterium heidelbergense]WCZ37298.1 ESX-1 secretion system protein eccB1 [Corynebacterium heidelbergense]
MRTTGLQVSGYNFLLRRLELALVIGDPRMAHDPLRSQRRALIVGVLVALLICGGAVMMALLRPAPSLNGAELAQDEKGTLHVRLEDGYHPVTNVASARLILGQPVEVKKATSGQLAKMPLGVPMGISDVPGLAPAPSQQWAVCDSGTVIAGPQARKIDNAVLTSPSGTWLIHRDSRTLVPPGTGRALGVQPGEVSEEFIEQFQRRADSILPTGPTGLPAPYDVSGRVFTAGERMFVAVPGGVGEVRGAQRVLAEWNAPDVALEQALSVLLALPSAEVLPHVPAAAEVKWQTPAVPCVGREGLVVPAQRPQDNRDQRTYLGPRGTAAVLTERGYVLVSEHGLRYTVGSAKDFAALGFTSYDEVPWRILAPLPDAGALNGSRARAGVVPAQSQQQ